MQEIIQLQLANYKNIKHVKHKKFFVCFCLNSGLSMYIIVNEPYTSFITIEVTFVLIPKRKNHKNQILPSPALSQC